MVDEIVIAIIVIGAIIVLVRIANAILRVALVVLIVCLIGGYGVSSSYSIKIEDNKLIYKIAGEAGEIGIDTIGKIEVVEGENKQKILTVSSRVGDKIFETEINPMVYKLFVKRGIDKIGDYIKNE